MKTMATHTSATTREHASDSTQTPHVNQTTRTATINNALKRRAQAVLNDKSIDSQTRAIIRFGLETNDPWLAALVRRAEAGESLADTFYYSQTAHPSEAGPSDDGPHTGCPSRQKIEALAEIICGAGDESAGALFVLMGTLQRSNQPEALANAVKHLAFTRCGELNLFGIVDAQIAVLESELLAHGTPVS
jgi:hypothetical protein